ncbi:MAG: F0F1 ATP synthase subunit epsilon [Terriglobales bacterium]
MADTLTLILVTPQKLVLSAKAHWVEIPATSGEMRALPGHAPTLGELGEGTLRYEAASGTEQNRQSVKIKGGFFEVLGDKVTLLADATA